MSNIAGSDTQLAWLHRAGMDREIASDVDIELFWTESWHGHRTCMDDKI